MRLGSSGLIRRIAYFGFCYLAPLRSVCRGNAVKSPFQVLECDLLSHCIWNLKRLSSSFLLVGQSKKPFSKQPLRSEVDTKPLLTSEYSYFSSASLSHRAFDSLFPCLAVITLLCLMRLLSDLLDQDQCWRNHFIRRKSRDLPHTNKIRYKPLYKQLRPLHAQIRLEANNRKKVER